MPDQRILVVDDHRDMADGIAMLLGEVPLDVQVAYSARAALECMEKDEFALVLSDVRMPSMDGMKLLARVKTRWPRTRVVLLTGHGSIDSAVEAMKQGADDYLTKPFNNSALIDVVRRNISRSSDTDHFDVPSIVADVAAVLSPDDLLPSLRAALEVLRCATGADDCELFLSEPDGRDSLLAVRVGPDAEALASRTRFEMNVGYPGIVMSTGKPLLTQGNLADDPRYLRHAVVEIGIRSYVCVPVSEPRGSLGSIHLLSRRHDFPVEHGARLFELAAAPIASAVRAGLATMRQAVDVACAPHEDGSTAQMRALLDAIRKAAGASGGTLALIDSQTGLPATVVSTEPPSLLCARAEAGGWSDCPSVLLGHGFAGELGRRQWPLVCRRGLPGRVLSPCCLPLTANGRFHGLITLELGRKNGWEAVSRLVPLLTMAQQVAMRLQSHHAGISVDEHGGEAATTSLSSAPPELEIFCLGPFRLIQRGQPISAEAFTRSKALVVLKLLALKWGAPVSRDFLVEQLWPDADPDSGYNRLHGLVHALRSVIEPYRTERRWIYVRNRGELYYLDSDAPIDIDLYRYRALVAQGMRSRSEQLLEAITALEAAVELYRGDLFEDDPYADWCGDERRELQARQLEALDHLARLHTQQGEPERAAGHLRRAVQLAPWREDLLRTLLDLLVALGRPAEALAQYNDYRHALRAELDTSPSPELEALHRRLSSSARRTS